MKVGALIFDMDGTMIDSMPFHGVAQVRDHEQLIKTKFLESLDA